MTLEILNEQISKGFYTKNILTSYCILILSRWENNKFHNTPVSVQGIFSKKILSIFYISNVQAVSKAVT